MVCASLYVWALSPQCDFTSIIVTEEGSKDSKDKYSKRAAQHVEDEQAFKRLARVCFVPVISAMGCNHGFPPLTTKTRERMGLSVVCVFVLLLMCTVLW